MASDFLLPHADAGATGAAAGDCFFTASAADLGALFSPPAAGGFAAGFDLVDELLDETAGFHADALACSEDVGTNSFAEAASFLLSAGIAAGVYVAAFLSFRDLRTRVLWSGVGVVGRAEFLSVSDTDTLVTTISPFRCS